jgi:hypothetical protein
MDPEPPPAVDRDEATVTCLTGRSRQGWNGQALGGRDGQQANEPHPSTGEQASNMNAENADHNGVDVRQHFLRDVTRIMGGLQRICAATLRTPEDGAELTPRMLEEGETVLVAEVEPGHKLKISFNDEVDENGNDSPLETCPEEHHGLTLCQPYVRNECSKAG